MEVPCAVEYLDTISPQFIGDLISWGLIYYHFVILYFFFSFLKQLNLFFFFLSQKFKKVQLELEQLKVKFIEN